MTPYGLIHAYEVTLSFLLFFFLIPIWTISCFILYFYKQVTSKNSLPVLNFIPCIQFSVPTISLQSSLLSCQ